MIAGATRPIAQASPLDELARALAAPSWGTAERYVQISVALAGAEAEALFEALPDEDAVFWSDGSETVVGLGVAALFVASGADRFAALRESTRTLPAWARLFAGFAFTASRAPVAPFGDARAILPRFLVRQAEGQTTLSLTLDLASDDEAVRRRLLAALDQLAGALRSGPPVLTATSHRPVEDLAEGDAFRALVGEARRAIRGGAFDKVVVHRQTRLSAGGRSPGAVLYHLGRSQPTSTRYAFRVEGQTFLGATPERLVRRAGRAIYADVLAGSLPRDGAEVAADALLRSDKDRAEHELTRRWIVEALEPHCASLEAVGPSVRALPHLFHLHTAIEGQLAVPTHVLELVEALHPTPAVGGAPRGSALSFIAEHEPAPRGWYAAPVGWFTPDGDGDFSVALRCALVSSADTTLYAGAGIVADSDPDRELAETASKRRAMLAALGLEDGR